MKLSFSGSERCSRPGIAQGVRWSPDSWQFTGQVVWKVIDKGRIDGETVDTVADFNSGGSKITADGDCSHEIKTLTPWKESYDQPR